MSPVKQGENRDMAKSRTSFKPGQSGNPNGRPRTEVSITSQIKKYLEEHPDDIKDIIIKLIEKSKAGEKEHLKILLERVDGKVVERHEHGGPDGGPVPIKMIRVSRPDEDIQD